MLRGTDILLAGLWGGRPADVVRLDYDRRTRRRIVPHGRRRAGVPARPGQGAGAARGRRHPARGRAHRRRRGGAGAAARDHLRRRASAGAHRLAPRQPASRHRDRRPCHPYPRRPRDRRHGARPRRQGARRRAAVQSRRAAPTARARCTGTAMGTATVTIMATTMAIITTSGTARSLPPWGRDRRGGIPDLCRSVSPHPYPLPLRGAPRERTLARLMIWLSPAYPVGGYSYSHGLEWVVETGEVKNAAEPRRSGSRTCWCTARDAAT